MASLPVLRERWVDRRRSREELLGQEDRAQCGQRHPRKSLGSLPHTLAETAADAQPELGDDERL